MCQQEAKRRGSTSLDAKKTADIGRGGQHCAHVRITLAAKLREQHQGRHPGMQRSNECRKQAPCSAVCLQKVQALSSWYIVCRAHVFEVRVVSLITRWALSCLTDAAAAEGAAAEGGLVRRRGGPAAAAAVGGSTALCSPQHAHAASSCSSHHPCEVFRHGRV